MFPYKPFLSGTLATHATHSVRLVGIQLACLVDCSRRILLTDNNIRWTVKHFGACKPRNGHGSQVASRTWFSNHENLATSILEG